MRNLSTALVAAFIAACICSCAKTEAPVNGPEKAVADCGHSALEHHPAQSPTYEDFGTAEYWECSSCGCRFYDSEAKTPFTGFKYILPTKYLDLTAYLPQYTTKSEVETITAIVAVAGLAVTLGGLVTTVLALTEATDEIADKIDELSEIEEKNAEQLRMLQELSEELVVKVEELNDSLALTSQNLSELIVQMNTTQKLMNSTEALEDAVLSAILKAENDIEVSKLLDSRYQQLQDLKFSCVSAFRAMNEYFSRTQTELESSQTMADSLAVYADLRKHLTKVISDWGSERACYPSLTSTLLAEFLGMTYNDNTSFPDLFAEKAVDAEVLPFDHQVLIVKELFTERELCILSLANALSGCYYRKCCGRGNLYAINTADAMDKKLSQCYNLRDISTEKWIAQSNVAPWHCNVTDKYFQGDIVFLNTKDFVSNNTMTMANGRMVSCTNSLSTFYVVSQEEALSEMEWELMLKDFLILNGHQAKDLEELLFSTGRPGMIFRDTAPIDCIKNHFSMAFSIPYSSDEYFSLIGQDIYYYCRGMEMKFCSNVAVYRIVSNPTQNGTNKCNYCTNNGYTRFYTVRASATK